jgi:hypothetical protein
MRVLMSSKKFELLPPEVTLEEDLSKLIDSPFFMPFKTFAISGIGPKISQIVLVRTVQFCLAILIPSGKHVPDATPS